MFLVSDTLSTNLVEFSWVIRFIFFAGQLASLWNVFLKALNSSSLRWTDSGCQENPNLTTKSMFFYVTRRIETNVFIFSSKVENMYLSCTYRDTVLIHLHTFAPGRCREGKNYQTEEAQSGLQSIICVACNLCSVFYFTMTPAGLRSFKPRMMCECSHLVV